MELTENSNKDRNSSLNIREFVSAGLKLSVAFFLLPDSATEQSSVHRCMQS